jgi:hypothetical protein
MPITRISQLKKWRVPELKKILKDNGIKFKSKSNKMKLISMIGELKNFKELKKTITIPVRIKKPPSAKQLAARKKFSEMVKGKSKKVVKVIEKEVKKVEKVVEKVVVPIKKKVEKVVAPISEVSKQIKEISSLGLENTSSREEPMPSAKAPVDIVIPKSARRQLFDSAFGIREFSFSNELSKVIDEMEHQGKLDKFLDLSKKDKKKLLKKRFNAASSITSLVNLF